MVDFKLLLNPPISLKSGILRRRCRQEIRTMPQYNPQKSNSSQLLLEENHQNTTPRLKKRYVAAALLVIFIIALIVIGYYLGIFSKRKKDEVLVPPNPTKPLPPSASRLHTFGKAAVCADGVPCAEIGKDILAKNGSAMDSTIAAMFCNGIVTMQSMGLGGGFLMTIYKRDEKKAYVLNAREKAPLKAKNEMYKDKKTSTSGPLAIAVPGELKGYWTAHKRFGILPWKDIIQPSIELCERGYTITKHQQDTLQKNDLHNDPNLMEWFKDSKGKFKKMGDKVIPTKLCKTLRLIAENGGDDLYNGTLSKMFVDDMKEIGSLVSEQDLQEYNAEFQEPVSIEFNNGDKLFSVPPPGSGLILGFILNILDGYNFTRSSIDGIDNTITTYHRIIEAFKYAYAKRTELGDTNFVNISSLIKNLTSNEYADQTRMEIKDNSTSINPKDYGAVFYTKDDHGTAHISVLAENGDAVSVTSSVNIYFGAGHTSKQTGIIVNSVMDDFSFPAYENYFGLPGSPNNEMKPGKRPISSMTPSILVDSKGDVRMVVGASGGTKITSAVAQVILRTLWFGENIKEAVDAPRLHHQLFPMEVDYEYGVLKQIVDGLKALGHSTKRSEGAGSIICAIIKQAQQIVANADYRKGGDVYGYS